jgi:hypothetical protein
VSEDWVELGQYAPMEAEVLKAALESVDIEVVSLTETVGRIYALTASSLGSVTLLVPVDREQEARALINDSQPVGFPEGD